MPRRKWLIDPAARGHYIDCALLESETANLYTGLTSVDQNVISREIWTTSDGRELQVYLLLRDQGNEYSYLLAEGPTEALDWFEARFISDQCAEVKID